MKRMIDNKDYDTLKNNVSELGAKVDNVKDIKTITIEATQLVDETHAQLTDEQYNIINSNSFIKVIFPTAQEIGFNVLKGSASLQLSACICSSAEISYFSGNINTTTKIVTLSFGDFSGGGKQLYQHNVTMQYSYYIIHFEIINDSNTSITSVSEIKDYLFNNNFKFDYNAKACSGFMNNGSNVGIIYGIHRLTASGYIKADYLKNGTPTTEDIADPTTISDNVIAL